MSLAPGTRLGPYEVVAPLGAGGMGEVYRARDTQLKRDVALKVLPAALATDADRLARFQREAELLASLNHPHIAHIYGFEYSQPVGSKDPALHSDGAPGLQPRGISAIVMELVEGPTLADVIARHAGAKAPASSTWIPGASAPGIPLDDALPIARQIAEALEYAHERGIVHRDLKPANIKITPDGHVKVLDFGLAKALAPDLATAAGDLEAANSPTITTPAMTQAGIILGTAAYMSPEQARGRPVDKRADIWAFGVVLYEMLTGRRAFEAASVTDTIAAVVLRDPDWSALPADTPRTIRRLLTRCLTKDAKQRLHDIADARLEIEEALGAPAQNEVTPATPGTPAWRRHVPWGIAVVSLGVAALALSPWITGKGGGSDEVRSRQLTFEGSANHPVLSPDGGFLAYDVVSCSPGEACRAQLMVQDLTSVEPIPLLGANLNIAGEEVPPIWFWSIEWSPDGERIIYTASYGEHEPLKGVYTIPRLGGTPDLVAAEGATTSAAFRPDMAVDWIAFPDGLQGQPVLRTRRAGSLEEPETHALPMRATFHQWSPDGRWLAVIGSVTSDLFGSARLVILDQRLEEQDAFDLGRGAGTNLWPKIRWGPASDVLYTMAAGDLLAVAVDAGSGAFAGDVREVLTDAESRGWPLGQFDVSADGQSLIFVRANQRIEIRTQTTDGDMRSTVAAGMTWRDYPALSPNGEQIAYVREDRLGANVYLRPFSGGREQALTTTPGHKTHPQWSFDGTHLGYITYEPEGAWLETVSAVNRRTRRIGRIASTLFAPFAWFQNQAKLLFRSDTDILWTATLDGEREELFPLSDRRGILWGFLVSPDGTQVAAFNHGYGSAEGQDVWIEVASLQSGAPEWRQMFHEDWVTTFDVGPWYDTAIGPTNWRAQSLQLWRSGDLLLALSTRNRGKVAAGLWAIPVGGGPAKQLLDLGPTCGAPSFVSITPDGKRLVCTYRQIESDIWQIDNFDPRRR